jgi:hypothetical protein
MAALPNNSMPKGIERGVSMAAPIPCIALNIIIIVSEVESPQNIDEEPKTKRPIIKSFFLPKISAILEKFIKRAEKGIK